MSTSNTRVAIVGGARTPFAKAATRFKNYSALNLAVHAVDGLLENNNSTPTLLMNWFTA